MQQDTGHPEKYRGKYFQLGNEHYNTNSVEQVAAMEEKARELGIGKTLFYLFPENTFLNATDIQKAGDAFSLNSALFPPFFLLAHFGRSHYCPSGASLRSTIVPVVVGGLQMSGNWPF